MTTKKQLLHIAGQIDALMRTLDAMNKDAQNVFGDYSISGQHETGNIIVILGGCARRLTKLAGVIK